MHDAIKTDDIYEAAGLLGSLSGIVSSAFDAHKASLTVADIKPNVKDKRLQKLVYLIRRLTVKDAEIYLQAMNNAIEHNKVRKTRDWKVEDMDITLL